MKKIVSLILGVFLFGQVAFAENATNFWKLSGTTLYPLKSTWSINVAGGITFGASTMSGALNMANYDIQNVGTMYVDADSNSGIGSAADNTIDFISNAITYMKLNANTLTFQGGSPTITTVSNTSFAIVPNGSGITRIGDAYATPLSVADNDDLLVTGGLEVGESLFTGGITMATNRGDVPFIDWSVTNASAAGAAQSLPFLIDGQFIMSLMSESDGSGGIQNKTVRVVALQSYGRIQAKQGTDVASATNTTLASDGNVFELTGTTKVDLISSVGWQEGSEVTLVCNESVTIDHGTATSGTNITIMLAGAGDFSCTANDTLTLILSSTTAGGHAWREKARTAI